jgi:hypothetical protein
MSTTEDPSCLLEQITWKEAREVIQPLRPELVSIIDALNPGKNFPLYRARYPYGSEILKGVVFSLPNASHQVVPIDDASIPAKIREDLYYNHGTIPAGIVTHNAAESFFDINDRFMPFSLMMPGRMIALQRVLDASVSLRGACIRNITAGARSIFMLPKISNDAGHKRIKREFNIVSDTPKALQEHWEVFVSLANSPQFQTPWHVEFIYFSKAWFDDNANDPAWGAFYRYLLESSWKNTRFWRNYVVLDLIYSRALSTKNIRPNAYLADTVKHLAIIGMGEALGFRLANDDVAAPISELESIYQNVYQMQNNYTASMMIPGLYDMNQPERSVYYSLRYPTAFEFSPKARTVSSTMRDLYEVKHIVDSVISDIRQRADILDTPFYALSQKVMIQYFHSEKCGFGEILPTQTLFETDAAFATLTQRRSSSVFCDTAPFFRGCMRFGPRPKSTLDDEIK